MNKLLAKISRCYCCSWPKPQTVQNANAADHSYVAFPHHMSKIPRLSPDFETQFSCKEDHLEATKTVSSAQISANELLHSDDSRLPISEKHRSPKKSSYSCSNYVEEVATGFDC